jgi:hypothetical protein
VAAGVEQHVRQCRTHLARRTQDVEMESIRQDRSAAMEDAIERPRAVSVSMADASRTLRAMWLTC